MTQWTLDNKIVDGAWQAFNADGPVLCEAMRCNVLEFLRGMADAVGWSPVGMVDDCMVLGHEDRPETLLVVWITHD